LAVNGTATALAIAIPAADKNERRPSTADNSVPTERTVDVVFWTENAATALYLYICIFIHLINNGTTNRKKLT
jgi:hypothetical protein